MTFIPPELKMSAVNVQEAFKGDKVDTDLHIEAPANKAEVRLAHCSHFVV